MTVCQYPKLIWKSPPGVLSAVLSKCVCRPCSVGRSARLAGWLASMERICEDEDAGRGGLRGCGLQGPSPRRCPRKSGLHVPDASAVALNVTQVGGCWLACQLHPSATLSASICCGFVSGECDPCHCVVRSCSWSV